MTDEPLALALPARRVDLPPTLADRVWRLSPLLLLAFVPWLVRPGAPALWFPLITAWLVAAVVMSAVSVDLFQQGGTRTPAVGAALAALACVVELVVGRFPDLLSHLGLVQVPAVVVGILGLGMLMLREEEPLPPVLAGAVAVVLLAGPVLALVVTSAVHRLDLDHFHVAEMQAGGLSVGYLPRLDGRQPSQVEIQGDRIELDYPSTASAAFVSVELTTGDPCELLTSVATACDTGGDDGVYRVRNDPTRVAVVRDDDEVFLVESSTAIPYDVVQRLLAAGRRPLSDLARLVTRDDLP